MADVLARPLHAGWEEEFPIKDIIEAFDDDDWEDEEWEDEDWDEDEDDWEDEDEDWEDEDDWDDDDDWGEDEDELSLGRRSRSSGWN